MGPRRGRRLGAHPRARGGRVIGTLRWAGPLVEGSGYAAEGRAFLRGALEAGVRVELSPTRLQPMTSIKKFCPLRAFHTLERQIAMR